MNNNRTTVTEEEIAAGRRKSDGKPIIDHRADDSSTFHDTFDANARELLEPVRETLIESTESCTREEIIGQMLMNFLNDDGFTGDDPESAFAGRFNTEQKRNLVALADHLGPDWAQALYHAAVFITKVA